MTHVPCWQNKIPSNIFQLKNNLRWIYPPTQDSSGKWIKVYFGIPEAKTIPPAGDDCILGWGTRSTPQIPRQILIFL